MKRQQRPEKKRRERVHSMFLTKVILLVLLAGIGFQLWHINGQVAEATAQLAALEDEAAQLEQKNEVLRKDISEGPTTEKMKEIAGDELDYVEPDVYVFEVFGG